ncbi:MAG TPA: glycoside hydrolase family 16 protein [Bacteroidales bacterium]|nr:glycoside hydrolase family 16 protein [Bacteroidales bacterium]
MKNRIWFKRKTNHILWLCLLMMLALPELDANNPTDQKEEYHLVWEENFDGAPLNETDHWTVILNGKGGGNKELQYYRRENIEIGKYPASGENCLIISAKKQKYRFKSFTSGRLSTQNKMAFRYGKVEARIKLPVTADGLWPAFWMLGADYPKAVWPKCGEIDILEMGSKKGITDGLQDRYFGGACHWGEKFNHGRYPNFGKSSVSPYSLQDGFHLYTLIWNANELKMYLDLDKHPDNAPYFELPIGGEDLPYKTAHYFHKPFFIILNLAVGGNYTQIKKGNMITAFKNGDAKMYVDFVRVYQKGDAGEVLLIRNK